MKLVEDWKSAWRFFSVQAMAIAAAIQAVWAALPEDMRASVPQHWVSYLTIALLIMGVAGRIIDQQTAPPPAP